MDVPEDSENNVKISDSGYSNSSNNSQSRRSRSSKSTHSGSHSSGSSGYGGKPSTSGSSNDLSQPPKKEKEIKKKKQVESLTTDSRKEGVCRPVDDISDIPSTGEVTTDVFMAPPLKNFPKKKDEENLNEPVQETNCVTDEGVVCTMSMTNVATTHADNHFTTSNCDGFSCVISMHDGVVLYVTSSLTSTLGFPNDMWIRRSFIDFIHPMDRNTFASQITNVLAVPRIVNQIQENAQSIENQESTMVCRIRRYKGLSSCFGVKDTTVAYMPFLLKFRFKHITDDTGTATYLVVQSIPLFSAFKTSNEVPRSTVSFVIRHNADGNVEYIDSESVQYLGYLPQDITNKNALLLYHPGDLAYLQHVYESIVKDGSVTRSKPFRMMTQNGYYIKVETEWSSFVNPWSKKLEFVTGKHYIIEGPDNPDVFQNPKNVLKLSEEQKNQVQMYRDSIIKIMKEALTKPAEIAKEQIHKRCEDVAMFLDFITEEQPKATEELKLQIQDTDHSNFERDSVMLGGISPHHEYNDSKSSTETPLSYNQLNYNDNLQRYFNSHQPSAFVDNNIMTPRNPVVLSTPHLPLSTCVSSVMQNSGDSAGLTSSGESGGMVVFNKDNHELDMERYHQLRLTESLLTKHNVEMEKELMKIHREHRSVSKADKEKVSSEKRQKKKEHLARCNATFQISTVENNTVSMYDKSQNLKRMSLQDESEATVNKRHYLPSCESSQRKEPTSTVGPIESRPIITTTVAPHWPSNPVNNVNTFILGVGMPPPMPIMNPLPVMQGVFPMYYAPPPASTNTTTEASSSVPNVQQNNNNQTQVQLPLAQCTTYGQPIYGSSIVYSPMIPQNPCFQQTVIPQNIYCGNTLNPLCLTNSNYEEVCRTSSIPTNSVSGMRRIKKHAPRLDRRVSNNESSNMDTNSLSQTPDQSSEGNQDANRQAGLCSPNINSLSASNSLSSKTSAPDSVPSGDIKGIGSLRRTETIDRTDGESSFSSFNSSFFKTDSSSAACSSDIKTPGNTGKIANATVPKTYNVPNQMKAPRRKIDPPWMEQVCVTSELLYKYQIIPKSLDEVLSADRQKMKSFEQPKLVNEQLEQLYLNLQLEGVAARLTLEEGITSSSSSGEEISNNVKVRKNTRRYSKLVMIHEENAPLPSPSEDTSSAPPDSAP